MCDEAQPLKTIIAGQQELGTKDHDAKLTYREGVSRRCLLATMAAAPALGVTVAEPARAQSIEDAAVHVQAALKDAKSTKLFRAIFITHHHPDHNIEYGPLLVIGWVGGMRLARLIRKSAPKERQSMRRRPS
jgi:hypothetical protein